MPDPNLNALWCRVIAEELHRGGVGHIVLCPGSRNSPLLFALATAFADKPDCRLSHVDERSAAFIALGMARMSGKPAVVCVTSGSAVANCIPALAEAEAAGIPLILVAADRPVELHDCGAPQTMRQAGAFLNFLTLEVALSEPVADEKELCTLRRRISQAAACPGSVLINVPLRDPLAPLQDPNFIFPALSSQALYGRGREPFVVVQPTSQYTKNVKEFSWLKRDMRGLILAGPSAHPRFAEHVRGMAKAVGFPLLADACSLARDDSSIMTGDALLTGPLGQIEPDLIIVCGGLPLVRTSFEYVDRQTCPILFIEDDQNRDWLSCAHARVSGLDQEVVTALGKACGPGNKEWLEKWQTADRKARASLTAAMKDEPWNEVLAAHITLSHGKFDFIHVASSLPVRHANLHSDGSRPILCNRGLNGIDGTLGSFLGECMASNERGLLMVGDLAFLHDLPALASAKACKNGGAIVITNNDGGGVFDFLPVSQVSEYERWVRTPHGMRFEHAAAQFGCSYKMVGDRKELTKALDDAASGKGFAIIECNVANSDTAQSHRRLLGRLVGA